MAPEYQPPEVQVPASFREADGWSPAQPMDHAPRGAWWQAFGDPLLDELEARAEAASPTLAAALARYDQARAAARVDEAGLFPDVSVSGSAVRRRVSGNRPLANGEPQTYSDYVAGGALSYELDLWGRIRDSVRASRAEAEASAADLAAARLSLQAAVADAYMRLRGLDAQAELLRQTVEAYERALELTQKRYRGGVASPIDVNRAQTVLANARAQISAIANERAATEHEIAALVGAVASDFRIPPGAATPVAPELPAGLPSELLQRRPDVAAAERRMFAANARIGVAKAAFFPSVTLGASGGWETTHGQLLETPNSYWALGPLSAALSIFDGGRRSARVKMSRADYEAQAARYRDTVLAAFRQVEDALAASRHLAAQAVDQREAAEAAARTAQLALTRYRNGAADYLAVVTAQTDELNARRALIAIETQRLRARIALVRALGGDVEKTDG